MLVAIAGGSGSGKTYLAEQLERALAPRVLRLSLDNFYLDRSHLTLARRARINFDHPRAIDWSRLEEVVNGLLHWQEVQVPAYDFKTHSRLPRGRRLSPKPVILLEGLWPLTRRTLRRLVSLSVFLDCPTRLRLRRRLLRDQAARGRSRGSIRKQFRECVEPMHILFVAPQARQADRVWTKTFGKREIRELARSIQELSRT